MGEDGNSIVNKYIVLEIILLVAVPTITIWIGIIMFHVWGIANDLQTIVDFIEATPTPSPGK